MIYMMAPYNDFVLAIMTFTIGVAFTWLVIYGFRRKDIVKKNSNKTFFPKLSVIVPVYNEEKDISKTLKSIFRANYPKNKMEVIVVNDASTDKSLSKIKKFPVKIISNKKNMGKVYSLNRAIKTAKGDVVITMDADSIVNRKAFSLMVRHFENENVGAVAGVYKTAYENKILEKMQSLEYMWFSLTRKIQEAIDCVLIVPGSLGAFRKSALLKVGGYDSDTMIEDYDMTIKMHKAGYKVKCEKDAIAKVCAPNTIASFIRQRTRWFRGGFQVYRKHSDVFLSRTGVISLLWMIEIFGILIQLVVFSFLGYEIVRHLIIYTIPEILFGVQTGITDLILMQTSFVELIVVSSVALFLIGMFNIVFSIDLMNERKRKIFLYPLMIVYSALVTFVFLKSVVEEAVGAKRVW